MDLMLLSPVPGLSQDAYWSQNGGAPWSMSQSGPAVRFEVRARDHWSGDPSGGGKERSEIALKKTLAFGRTYRLHYQFRLEPGAVNTAEWLLLGQMHQSGKPGVSHSPPVEIDLNGERMAVVVRSAGKPLSPGIRPVTRTIWSDGSEIRRGHWYDMMIDVRFDPSGDGLLAVSRDGIRVANYRGPLGFAGELEPYWKEGVYRAAAPETIAVSFRDLSIVEAGKSPPRLTAADLPASLRVREGPPADRSLQAQPKK